MFTSFSLAAEEQSWWEGIWEPTKEILTTGAEVFSKVAPLVMKPPKATGAYAPPVYRPTPIRPETPPAFSWPTFPTRQPTTTIVGPSYQPAGTAPLDMTWPLIALAGVAVFFAFQRR